MYVRVMQEACSGFASFRTSHVRYLGTHKRDVLQEGTDGQI